MFNKLLRNLPFNPSLIDQVTFYSKRLSKEAGIRSAGFILIALTMALQVFATIKPAEASLACDPSRNDIIQCGFKTKQEAVSKCNEDLQDFRKILLNRGISCEKLASAQEKTVNSRAYSNKLISLGRKPFQKPGEYAEKFAGLNYSLYWRPLSSWGNFESKMLVTSTNDGQMVMVMFECGNLVTLNDFKLVTPQPDSNLNIVKSNNPVGEVQPGSTIDYTLAFTNKGGNAAFFSVNDVLPSQVSYVSSSYGSWAFENKSPNLKWHNNTPPFYSFGNTDAFGTPGFITLKVKVNSDVPSGTTICNRAFLQDVVKGTNTVRNSSDTQVCNTVQKICPEGQILNENGITCDEVTAPDAVCVSLTAFHTTSDKTNQEYTFRTVADTAGGATIQSYEYRFGDGKTETVASSELKSEITHKYSRPDNYKAFVTVKSSVPDKPVLTCQTVAPVNPPEQSPTISIKKKAANITQKQADANGQTAQAGDVIEYTLTSTNVSSVNANDYTLLTEDLSDILEYADLDMTSLQGGVLDSETKVLAWNTKVDIKAGQSIAKVFRVTVKNPIPSTPRPDTQSTRTSGDLVMHNWYGNTVDIKLPTTVVKITEQTTTLTKTGPGESLLIGFITMTVVGYFFARSRLMVKELEIVKQEYTSGGEL